VVLDLFLSSPGLNVSLSKNGTMPISMVITSFSSQRQVFQEATVSSEESKSLASIDEVQCAIS